MPCLLVKPIKLFLALMVLFTYCMQVCAQDRFQPVVFRIDSLAGIGLPKSALAEVDKLESLARETHNPAQQVRAVIYRMTFQSYIEEDALAAIITRLRQDMGQAEYPVKPVLQSLLAGMYWNYYQQNRYQFGQRSKLEKPGDDITQWDLQTIIGETTRLYKLSLADDQREQNTPVSVLDGVLTGNKATRYLRPTLYDLLLHRSLDFFLADEPDIIKPKLPFSLNDSRFFSDSRTFANLQIAANDTSSTIYQGIKYLQRAVVYSVYI